MAAEGAGIVTATNRRCCESQFERGGPGRRESEASWGGALGSGLRVGFERVPGSRHGRAARGGGRLRLGSSCQGTRH